MRFSISATLDAIQTRLSLDPALAQAVVDVAEVVRLVGLDGDTGRPAWLPRLGQVVDALATHWGEDGMAVYPIAPRSLLSDLDLTSNERMVVRRWADDGLVEVLEQPGDRVPEVAELLSVPVIAAHGFDRYLDRYPWLPAAALAPGPSGLSGPGQPPVVPGSARLLARLWRCRQPGCAGFGHPHAGQRPPRLVGGAPTCPTHGERLVDAGPRPAGRALAVSVDGVVRGRFVVREGAPVLVGRAPEPPAGATAVALAPWLSGDALRWISRTHLRLELRGDVLVAVDHSTNGTGVHTVTGPARLPAGQAYQVAPDEEIELYEGVRLTRPGRRAGGQPAPSSVMGDAPTVSIRRG